MSDESRSDDVTTHHVRSALAGESTSIRWIIERFSPLLLAQAAHRLRNSRVGLGRVHSPEDIVQDVWLRALPRLVDLRTRDGRMTPVVVRFLATTLLHRLGSLMQTQRNTDDAPHLDELADARANSLSISATGVLRDVLGREQHDAVRAAIEALDETDRAVVILRGIEQNPVQDIALLLREKPNTITVRYRRALERLRDQLPNSIFAELDSGD